MRRKKTTKVVNKFRLSDEAVSFIEKFVLPEMKLAAPIDEDIMDEIIELAIQWETDMIDTSTENYRDRVDDYPERERDTAADKFVTEVTGQWDDDSSVPDFDDLNARLKQPRNR